MTSSPLFLPTPPKGSFRACLPAEKNPPGAATRSKHMFLARQGGDVVGDMLVAPATRGPDWSHYGVLRGVVLLQGWTAEAHWRFAAWLPASQGRVLTHKQFLCFTICRLLNAERADVKAQRRSGLQILSLPVHT